MEKLNCVIERVTYHNEENGFSVVKAKSVPSSIFMANGNSIQNSENNFLFNAVRNHFRQPSMGLKNTLAAVSLKGSVLLMLREL